jgi:hypothetical protein
LNKVFCKKAEILLDALFRCVLIPALLLGQVPVEVLRVSADINKAEKKLSLLKYMSFLKPGVI